MSSFGSTEWYQRVAAGLVSGTFIIHQFGFSSVGSVLLPVAPSGVWRTPAAAVSLEALSDSTDDDASGTGARELTIMGLDAAWQPITQVLAMAGTSPVALPSTMTRVNGFAVSRCGTYPEAGIDSHAGEITLREAGGGQTWSTIPTSPHAAGEALIGCYAVAAGRTAFVISAVREVDHNKAVDAIVAIREGADQPTPYPPRLDVFMSLGISGSFPFRPAAPAGPIVGPADIFVLANTAAGTGNLATDLELVELDSEI